MPCDSFRDWEANLRAIALSLEHLRAVDRYGVTTEEEEQYTGWLRLPAAGATDEAVECAKVLIIHASVGVDTAKLLGDRNVFD